LYLSFALKLRNSLLFPDGQRNGGSFVAFASTKIGDVKMDRRDQELLDKQMRRLSAPRNDGVIAVMLAVMFVVGMTLGGVLSEHETEPAHNASIE
jgi:hypothetical protein